MPMMTVLRAGWVTRVLKSRSEAATWAEARIPPREARTSARATASAAAALTTGNERASDATESTGPVYAGGPRWTRGWQCAGLGDILDRGADGPRKPPTREVMHPC